MQKGDKLVLGYKPNHFSAPDIFKYDLTHYAKVVYMYLQRHLTVEGESAPSKQEIAYYCECSKRTVDNAIEELEKVGLIQIIRRQKGPNLHDTNLYIIYHPEQIEELKLKPSYEEVKFAKKGKKAQKGSAPDAPPKKVVHEMHHPEKGSAPDALPPEESSNDAGFDEKVVHQMHPTSLLDLDRLVRLEEPAPADLSDEEIIKIAFKQHLKEEISDKQAEKFIEVALERDISLEELIEEMKYIATNVKIKKTATGTLYRSLQAGGWAKKKREEEAKELQKPKHRLVRRPVKHPHHVHDLPKSIRQQMEEQAAAKEQPVAREQTIDPQEVEKKRARLLAKIGLKAAGQQG